MFWPIWIATTVVGVLLVIWVVPGKKSIPRDSIPSRSHSWSRRAILSVTFLALLLACYVAGSLVWEDFSRADELNSYRQEAAEPLFSYHPRPSIPRWLSPYVNYLHVVSPVFSQNQLPDFCLDASVTVCK